MIEEQRSYGYHKFFLWNGFESSPWEWEAKAENEMKPISASIFPTLDLPSNLVNTQAYYITDLFTTKKSFTVLAAGWVSQNFWTKSHDIA
jgi:hypothetical protein